MAHSEFSETQFVFAYIRELYQARKSQHYIFPFGVNFLFPSTYQERETASDFIIKDFSHSEFYQFKRSDYLERRRGKTEVKSGIISSDLPYYRFEIYNEYSLTKMGQFDKLLELSKVSSRDWVYYVAPYFSKQKQFNEFFGNGEVMENSILIDCRKFNDPMYKPPYFDINDGDNHFFVFKKDKSFLRICSKSIEVELSENFEGESANPNSQPLNFRDYLNNLGERVLSGDRSQFQNSPNYFELDTLDQAYFVQNYLMKKYKILWNPLFRQNIYG